MIKTVFSIILLLIPFFSAKASDEALNKTKQKMQVLKVGYPNFDWAPFTYISHKGHVSGLLPSLMYEITKQTDYRIESVIYPTYRDVLTAFNNHEIDLLVGVSSTFERQKIMHFSEPLLITPMAIISKTPGIQNYSQIADQLIAIEQGFAIEEQLQQLSTTQLQLVSFPNSDLALNAVTQGLAGAYIGNAISLDDMHSRRGSDNNLYLNPLNDLPFERLYVAGHKEKPELIQSINQGYRTISPKKLAGLYDTWLTNSQQRYISSQSKLNLNAQERQWLEEKKNLTIAYHPADAPYQFTDEKGAMAGMSADIAKHLTEHLNLNLVPVPHTRFTDIIDLLNKGKIDAIAAVTCTPERSQLIACTQPFTEEQWVIVNSIASGKRVITKKTKLGVVSNRFGQVLTQQLYSDNPLQLFDNNELLLDAVAKGRTEAAVISLSSASALLQTKYLGRLQVIPGKLDQQHQPIGIAVAKNNLLLRDILNKTMNAIPPQQLSDIEKKWSNITLKAGVSYRKIGIWGFFFLCLCLVIFSSFIYWNRKLRREVKQRKETENKLTYLTNNFDGVLLQHIQHSNDPTDIELLFASAKIKELIGLSPSSLKRQPDQLIALLNQRKDGTALLQAMEKAVANGNWKTELQLQSPTAGKRWIEVRCHIIPVESGWQWNSILIDISQMKQQQQELETARHQAEIATETKSRFLAMMSHEIRTPISGILSLLELMIPHTKSSHQATEIRKHLNQSANNLLNIVNDVLDFSKIEAGKLTLQKNDSLIAELISDIVQPHVIHAGQKGLNFNLWVDPTLANRLTLDELRLKQVLNNLLNNATKFTESGSISFYLDVITQNSNHQQLRFMVTDTGIGISQQDIHKLFQPFEQADLSNERRFSGTGLGLSITHQLIQLMGGEITVESQPGQGSSFCIQLSTPVAEPTVISQFQKRCGILYSLDSKSPAISHYLECWDNTTTLLTITNKIELIAACQSLRFDLLILPEEWIEQQQITSEWAEFNLPGVQWLLIKQQALLSPEPTDIGWLISANPLIPEHLRHTLTTPSQMMTLNNKTAPLTVHTQMVTREQAISRNKLILVAEDHPINQQIINQQLQRLGYYADIVDNGAQALTSLGDSPYRLVLTDCQMPELDGYGLLKAIRQSHCSDSSRKTINTLPIVALTANNATHIRNGNRRYQFDDCLYKPVSLEQLRNILEKYLSPTELTASEDMWDLGTFVEPTEHVEQYVKPRVNNLQLISEHKTTNSHLAATIDIEQLKTIFGDTKTCRTLLKQYVDTCKSDFAELSQAATNNDNEALRLISHRMKGAARMMEFPALAAYCEAIETQAMNEEDRTEKEDIKTVSNLILQLEQQTRQL